MLATMMLHVNGETARMQIKDEMSEQVMYFDCSTGKRIYKGLVKEEDTKWGTAHSQVFDPVKGLFTFLSQKNEEDGVAINLDTFTLAGFGKNQNATSGNSSKDLSTIAGF